MPLFVFLVMLILIAPACTKEEVRRFGEGILKEMSETRVVALMHGFGSGDDTGMHELLKLLEGKAPSHITVVAEVFSSDEKDAAVAFLNEGLTSPDWMRRRSLARFSGRPSRCPVPAAGERTAEGASGPAVSGEAGPEKSLD
jgi:hypothetical protein